MAGKSVGDVMRQRFVSVTADTSLFEAANLMRVTQLRHLLVVSDQRPIGVVSRRDLLATCMKLRGSNPNASNDEVLKEHSVELVMIAPPETVCPSFSLSEAANRLLEHKVGLIAVTEKGESTQRLVGILTESDLLRASYAE